MLIDLLKKRRSRYELTNKLTISQAELEKLIGEVLWQMPSAFNMQSARVVLLLGEKHRALWKITEDALRAIVPADKFEPTAQKIHSFAAAYGTILYLEEENTIKQMQAKFAAYADNFPTWAQQANGMLQLAVWTALAEAGVGASLQHYNPLIDEAVKKEFNLPSTWKLIAQMPFGKAAGPDTQKTFLPLAERLQVLQ